MTPPRMYEWITFDCYGTLVDWEEGIFRAFASALPDDAFVDRRALLEAHAEVEPALQSGEFRPYREILAGCVRAVAARLGLPVDEGRERFLADSLSGWPVFEDTAPALQRLSDAGYRLGILSNVDDDLLRGTLDRLEIEFAMTITAQQVRGYKPGRAHFDAAQERIGSSRWLHAAQSYFHDVVPASGLGIPVAWINRKSERPAAGARPDHDLRNLTDLADLLT